MGDGTQKPSDENKGTPTEGQPRAFWHQYEGMPVAIQFREGVRYFAIGYPNALMRDPRAEEGQMVPIAVPIILGILHVDEDHTGLRLSVESEDPQGAQRAKMHIILHPDDTAFITVGEQRLID